MYQPHHREKDPSPSERADAIDELSNLLTLPDLNEFDVRHRQRGFVVAVMYLIRSGIKDKALQEDCVEYFAVSLKNQGILRGEDEQRFLSLARTWLII